MRKILTTLTIALAVCSMLSSCTGTKVDPEFLQGTTDGLDVKGNSLFTYNQLTCQTSYNSEKHEFRTFTDNMSDYYCVTLDTTPTAEGQKVKGDITWTSDSEVVTKKGLTFHVEKFDRNGRMWLWCRKESIGVIIQTLY